MWEKVNFVVFVQTWIIVSAGRCNIGSLFCENHWEPPAQLSLWVNWRSWQKSEACIIKQVHFPLCPSGANLRAEVHDASFPLSGINTDERTAPWPINFLKNTAWISVQLCTFWKVYCVRDFPFLTPICFSPFVFFSIYITFKTTAAGQSAVQV